MKEGDQRTYEAIHKKIVISYKDAYSFNAGQLKKKSKLCKAGLAIFVISLFFLFISIIHTDMSSNQFVGGEEDDTPSYDTVTKGEDGDDTQPSYDVKTLNE